jgi:hypothetical protein
MTALTATTPNVEDASDPPGRGHLTGRQLVGLAHHYQDLARQHPGEEHFWQSRALYYGRLSWRQ